MDKLNPVDEVTGYRELSREEIDMMNEVKNLAVQVGTMIEELSATAGLDQRSVALAKTQLQQGFMWAVRSIAQPTSF